MQDSITTTIMQVGKPMKRVTVEYVIYSLCCSEAHPNEHWSEYRASFPTKESAITEMDSWTSNYKHKLIKRTTTEEEIDLT